MEIWKWIDGFEGVYQISNKGRLKSFKVNKNGTTTMYTNKNNDYFSIILKHNGKKRHCRIHELVAEAFIGDRPNGYQVHHIDENKQNNCVENLKYMSTKEHRLETIRLNPNSICGMINYNKNIRPKRIFQYDLKGNFIKKYQNAKEASRETGVCQRNILQVANKDEYKPGLARKQAGGFVWKFE